MRWMFERVADLLDSRSVRVGAAAAAAVLVAGVVVVVVLPLLRGDTAAPPATEPPTVTEPAPTAADTETTIPAAEEPATPTVAVSDEAAESVTTAETPTETTVPPSPPGTVSAEQIAEAGLSIPSTTLVTAGADCEGMSYRAEMFVWDQCVLDALAARLEDLYSGRHAVRTAAVRDGWALSGVFEDLAAEGAERFGTEAAGDPSHYGSLWSDVEGYEWRTVELHGAQWVRRHLVNARFRVVFNDGSFTTPWTVASFSHVGGQWQVSFASFCRFLGSERCPPDPRPEVAEATSEASAPFYDPADDPWPVPAPAADVVW